MRKHYLLNFYYFYSSFYISYTFLPLVLHHLAYNAKIIYTLANNDKNGTKRFNSVSNRFAKKGFISKPLSG